MDGCAPPFNIPGMIRFPNVNTNKQRFPGEVAARLRLCGIGGGIAPPSPEGMGVSFGGKGAPSIARCTSSGTSWGTPNRWSWRFGDLTFTWESTPITKLEAGEHRKSLPYAGLWRLELLDPITPSKSLCCFSQRESSQQRVPILFHGFEL